MNSRTAGHAPALQSSMPSAPPPAVRSGTRRGRRSRQLRPVAMVASAVALAGAITAAAVPMAQAGTTSSSSTIRLNSVTKSMTKISGAAFVEVDADRNAAGKNVAADTLICRVTSPRKPPKCAATINLARGDLFFTVTGTMTGASGRLVRGTGIYARDSGTIVATNTSATHTRVVIRLHK